MRDFIERLKSKPEHVRRRIALGTSVGVTGVVTAVWFFGLLFSGSLSDVSGSGSSDGTLAQAGASAVTQTKTNFQQLLGAVGVATTPQAAPALAPVGATTSSSDATSSEQTVIPF